MLVILHAVGQRPGEFFYQSAQNFSNGGFHQWVFLYPRKNCTAAFFCLSNKAKTKWYVAARDGTHAVEKENE